MTGLDDATLGHLRQVLRDLPDDPLGEGPHGARYELREEVGRGGMGVVHRAYDRRLDREVAIKVLAAGAGIREHDAMAARLVREAKILARLEHPGIVPIHEVGTLEDGRVFAAMKLVRGSPLSAHLRPVPPEHGVVGVLGELEPRLRLFLKILEAVAFAHAQGVVHCDLKPSNVMVGAFGEVLVMDWGLAKLIGAPLDNDPPGAPSPAAPSGNATAASHDATAPGTVLGTPGYMAPEQERGDRSAVDARTDIFALGAILRDLIGPVGGAAGPPALLSIASRAQAATPGERYPTVAAMAADIERFLAREPVSAHRERLGEVLQRWYRRYETAILLVIAYLLLRVAFAVWPRT